jgi:hypothetical protein
LNILFALAYLVKLLYDIIMGKRSYVFSNFNCREVLNIFGLLVLSIVFMLGWSSISMWAFLNTIQSHAYTLTGMHGVFTILFYMVTCKR